MAGMICPRCGRAQPPDAEPSVFCVHCGQFLVHTRWVATPPESVTSAPPRQPRARYTGPPRYLSPPRWGFPPQPWRRAEPERSRDWAGASASHAGLVVPLLRGVAALAVVCAAGEVWRYWLLLRSRSQALSAREVAASDALVQAASWMCTLMTVVAGVALLVWVFRVVAAAAERSGARPSRSRWAVLLGWLLPPVNLSVPGSVLAEVEHAALGRRPGERVRPSRLLLTWWVLWAANVVLFLLTAVWSVRTGVQAKADGVVLHALLDLLAAATALVTARVVGWLTALVTPAKPIPLPRVVTVTESGTKAAESGPGRASTVVRR